jgi:hypothetical protein
MKLFDEQFVQRLTRRSLLERGAYGVGAAALASLMGRATNAMAAPTPAGGLYPGVVWPRHVAPKAKRVIHLCMAGGPSHLETFDNKPRLGEMTGQPMPESFTKGQPIAQLQNQQLKWHGPKWGFKRFGKSGQEVCELFPHIGSVADDICIVRSMVTEAINHDPAHTFMNTGTTISGRPSMGSWVWYGLGAECDDLPGFVVLTSTGRAGQKQPIASRQWSSGFLPSKYSGIRLNSKGDAVYYINSPSGVSRGRQRDVIDAVDKLNTINEGVTADPEIATRIAQYEMAFKMQASVPGLMDVSGEPQSMLELYGAKPGDGSYASNCLLARRLAERGVRFIQLYHRDWDHHGGVKDQIKLIAPEVDQATAALITDLKTRGMLDETLIVWGGEFGRTPMAQGNGRDHHQKAFSIFMAGGGIKGGVTHGATDELGYYAVENVVPVHDMHATMLHLLGVDHKRLTFKFQGRDFRLTDVHGNLVNEILA